MILERRHDGLPGVCIGIGRSVFWVCGATSDERGELIRKKQIVGVKVHGVRASHPYSAMGFWGEFEAWNEGAEGDVVICDMALPRGVIIRNGVLYGPARKSKPPEKLEVRPPESRSAARPATLAPAHEASERRLARIRIIYPDGGSARLAAAVIASRRGTSDRGARFGQGGRFLQTSVGFIKMAASALFPRRGISLLSRLQSCQKS